MTKEEFRILVKAMKAVYAQPTFIPDKDAFNVWYELLKDLSYMQANIAIQKHMMTERFPPTIADLRSGAEEVTREQIREMSELESWSLVRKAIRNSGYHAREEFEALPEACQAAVGSSDNLREWALMETDQVETVEQSHFIRSYRTAVKRINEDRKLPEAFRQQIAQMRQEALQQKEKPVPRVEEKVEDRPQEKIGMSAETRRKLDILLGR